MNETLQSFDKLPVPDARSNDWAYSRLYFAASIETERMRTGRLDELGAEVIVRLSDLVAILSRNNPTS